jgi:hypothetical protein
MKKNLFLMLTLVMISAASVNGQVRIGGLTDPDPSAILDLNPDKVGGVEQDATGGLMMPKVNLVEVTDPAPFGANAKGLIVYHKATGADNKLSEGIYYNNGRTWVMLVSSENINEEAGAPIMFLRQPGFLWLGPDGTATDTLRLELAATAQSNFTYQWYKRNPETLLSEPIEGAESDMLIINPEGEAPDREDYGITDIGRYYQFFCVVVSGSRYSISGTGRAAFGPGARLGTDGWINVAPANLGADQGKSLADQLSYRPEDAYDPIVYGDWYQWGRIKDGHEDRRVLADGTNAVYFVTDNGVGTDSLDASGQIHITNPDITPIIFGKFIRRDVGTNDWRQYPEENGNFAIAPADAWTWNNPDNDPCKKLDNHWRVPTQAEWAQIASSNTWVWKAGDTSGTAGYEIKPGGARKPTSLFLPATGGRARGVGTQWGVGTYGYYWSSTITGTNSYHLYFTPETINPTYTNGRSSGITIRCVSESFDPE